MNAPTSMRPDRFKALLASYGADLRRWPEAERAGAEALLMVSAEAQSAFDETCLLDHVLHSAQSAQDARLWKHGEQNAALARLRAGVAARIAPRLPGRQKPSWQSIALRPVLASGSPSPGLAWSMATTGGLVVIMAGLWIGWMETAAAPVGVLSILQFAPIHALGW